MDSVGPELQRPAKPGEDGAIEQIRAPPVRTPFAAAVVAVMGSALTSVCVLKGGTYYISKGTTDCVSHCVTHTARARDSVWGDKISVERSVASIIMSVRHLLLAI